MVLKQKGKPEKGKKPVRGGPRQFSDQREFPDGPIEEFDDLKVREEIDEPETEKDSTDSDSSSSEGELLVPNKPSNRPAAAVSAKKPSVTGSSSELSRRDREAIQKEQARQYYLKMKDKEDAARLALVRKEREAAAAKHAEELKAKEAAMRR